MSSHGRLYESWHDPKHPIWPMARTVVVLSALALVLWLNAEHFDETETRTIVTMFFALLGAEGLSGAFSKKDS